MLTTSQVSFFFFNDTATTEIYTLSLHDALPISAKIHEHQCPEVALFKNDFPGYRVMAASKPSVTFDVLYFLRDRKSTRLNSSHANISYAVFCLKKKKKNK